MDPRRKMVNSKQSGDFDACIRCETFPRKFVVKRPDYYAFFLHERASKPEQTAPTSSPQLSFSCVILIERIDNKQPHHYQNHCAWHPLSFNVCALLAIDPREFLIDIDTYQSYLSQKSANSPGRLEDSIDTINLSRQLRRWRWTTKIIKKASMFSAWEIIKGYVGQNAVYCMIFVS